MCSPHLSHVTTADTVHLPHRRRASSTSSADLFPGRTASLPSLETQLQDSQELYALLLSLTKEGDNVDRVKEIQSGVMKTRDEMEDSRKKRQAVSGGTIWHNAVKPFDSSELVYNWERFEDYSVLEPPTLDPKGTLSMSLEGNEVHIPDKESSSMESSGLYLPTLSSDGNSVGLWSSAASTGTSLHVPSESMGNESFWGIINGATSKSINGVINEPVTSVPSGAVNMMGGAVNTMGGSSNTMEGVANTMEGVANTMGEAVNMMGGSSNTVGGVANTMNGTVNTLGGAATIIATPTTATSTTAATTTTTSVSSGSVNGSVNGITNPTPSSIPSGSANSPESNNQTAAFAPPNASTEVGSAPISYVSLSNPADHSNVPESNPVNPALPHLTISTTNLSPPSNASGTFSCGSPSSSVVSAMSPTIRPILASPRLNMPGSSLISPPQIRKKPVSSSALMSGHAKTLSDNVSSSRPLPISASLSLNSPQPSQSVNLSVPGSSSPTSRQDSTRLFSGQIHIPFVQSQSPSLNRPSSGDQWPLSTETVSARLNEDILHKSSASSDDSFFPERAHSGKEVIVPNRISMDENMMPVLDSPISQSTQNNHPVLSATLSASSTYSRSKRMLTRAPEVASSQPEEIVLGMPKDSRSDNSRVSIFVNDLEPKSTNEESDFMDELDQNLPADFQKEFISEAESMTGLQCSVCCIHKLRHVNHLYNIP